MKVIFVYVAMLNEGNEELADMNAVDTEIEGKCLVLRFCRGNGA